MGGDKLKHLPLIHFKYNHHSSITNTKQSETNSNSKPQSQVQDQNNSFNKISTNIKGFRKKIEEQRKSDDNEGDLSDIPQDYIPRTLPNDPNDELHKIQNHLSRNLEDHNRINQDGVTIPYGIQPSNLNGFTNTQQSHYLDPNEIEKHPKLFPIQRKLEKKHPRQEHVEVYNYLNPRKTANMTYNEKISNWLSSIPLIAKNNNTSGGNFFTNNENLSPNYKIDCYPGVVSHSITASNTSNGEIDLTDVDDIIELQAQKVTKYVTRLYYNENETNDNIVEDHSSGGNDDEEELIVDQKIPRLITVQEGDEKGQNYDATPSKSFQH
ncbi:hypothetical protein KGF54_001858 [Candida jiufengensis]|uniref:uncharacterized protein n=1 Tax=Candida jiufengensis TaxID=497108 RepID=UPI0022248ED3|nr:uncharacterized protein KGF54_001858 [Candida jiufengensis]KAI5955297.1 hypothetical protein KGF54_001858 [Candida jiufengensis]